MTDYRKKKQNHGQKPALLVFIICLSLLVFLLLLIQLYPEQDSAPAEIPVEIPAEETENTEDPSPVLPEEDTPENPPADYDYTLPVPESESVDLSYFNDALFIGDSRTEGLILNLSLSDFHAVTQKGLMVNTLFTKPFFECDGKKITGIEVIRNSSFSKAYIMLGINELGWSNQNLFLEKYGQLIDELRAVNPDAVIYIQSLLPVSREISDTHEYIHNEKIMEYNQLLSGLAAEKEVFFLDTFTSVADENGCLPEDAATDGIHMKKEYCEKWLAYLENHTVLPQE